jgi:PAS domain S-box-containing protein
MEKKILLVDNHPVMLKFMTNFLEKEGYQVRAAEDGLSALDILETYYPDFIFVDLVMPNISGDKLCRIIRRMPELENVNLVVLSAIAAEEHVDFTEFGADACIAKGPFDKMAKHVLDVLGGSAAEPKSRLPDKILGSEEVSPRQITKELLVSKRHFEAILGNMSEGILELTLEPRIVYANPTALSLIGMPEEMLLGLNFVKLFSGMDRKRVEVLMGIRDQTLKRISEDAPVRLNKKEVSLNLLTVTDEGNESLIVIMSDVSERKRMQAQLQEAQKMEAIGTLAGGIAHDFNNILMGIQGNTSLMLLNIDSSHPHYERLNTVEKLVQSGSQLTRQILGYAREGKYQVKAVNLNQIVRDTSDTFGRAKKDITIQRFLAEDLYTIDADQGQIEQALLSLYVNAWQAMSDGGELTLETRNTTDRQMHDKMYHPKPGDYVLLRISDSGVGMDNKTLERIFDPFFTTKGMRRGAGLGLASVYGIVKGHGGYIDVESEEGSGTTFSIYLPASRKPLTEKKAMSESMSTGNETILFVDDEAMILSVGQELLETLGYRVLLARSGKEAVEVYREKQETIDMVILDMIMPELSGAETYDRLKKIDPEIKVLLSSGYSVNSQAEEILARGCDGFIQKPFNLNQLASKIKEILPENQKDVKDG